MRPAPTRTSTDRRADRAVPAGRRRVPVERLERRRAGAGRRARRRHRCAGQDLGQRAGRRPGGPGGGRLRGGAGQPAAAALRPDLRDASPVRRPGRELPAAVGEGGRGRRRRRRRPSAGWSRSLRPWWSGARRARCPGWATPPRCWCCAATSTYPTKRSPRSTGCCSRAGSGRTCASCTGCRPAGPTRAATPSWSCGMRWTWPTRRCRTRCPARCWPQRSIEGRIEPGATRQEVGYLSDPAIGGVRLGLPGDEVTIDLAEAGRAGHGPAGRRGG